VLRQGAFTCIGWQVTLCDPIWQVTSRSSRMSSRQKLYSALTLNWTHSCRQNQLREMKFNASKLSSVVYLANFMWSMHVWGICTKNTHPACGPLSVRSNTCRGFNIHCSLCIRRAPWFPPLRGLTNTSKGRESGLGTGLTTNVRPAPPTTIESSVEKLDSRRRDADRRRFRTDDLNKPCR